MATKTSELIQEKKTIEAFLRGSDKKPLDEAFHEKDREAKKELEDKYYHHIAMLIKHKSLSAVTENTKTLAKHDLASLAHDYAIGHFDRLLNKFPEDYHRDRDFFDKHNSLVSKRADDKSKDSGTDLTHPDKKGAMLHTNTIPMTGRSY